MNELFFIITLYAVLYLKEILFTSKTLLKIFSLFNIFNVYFCVL